MTLEEFKEFLNEFNQKNYDDCKDYSILIENNNFLIRYKFQELDNGQVIYENDSFAYEIILTLFSEVFIKNFYPQKSIDSHKFNINCFMTKESNEIEEVDLGDGQIDRYKIYYCDLEKILKEVKRIEYNFFL